MNYRRILNIIRLIFYFIVAIFSLIFVIEFAFIPLPEGYFGVSNYEIFLKNPSVGNPSTGLNLSLILLLITIIVIISFFIYDLITNKKKSQKAVAGFVILALVFLFSFLISNSANEMGISFLKSRLISSGIVTAIIALIVAFVLIAYTEVRHYFR